jgi:RNA polymerase sigma factor for flagellar operon FliA
VIAFPTTLTEAQCKLIEEHASLPAKIVSRMSKRLPSHVYTPDLVSAGVDGLVRAAQMFDAEKGVPFDSYAQMRVQGEVIDELRRLDPLTRRRRQSKQRLEEAQAALRQRLGHEPTDEDVRIELGLTEKKYRRLLSSVAHSEVSLDEVVGDDAGSRSRHDELADPQARPAHDGIESLEQLESMRRHVAALPERERAVVEGYARGRLGREIADDMGITESRVCQIHREVLAELRKLMTKPPGKKPAPYVAPPPPPVVVKPEPPPLHVVLTDPPPGTPSEQAEWAFADYWRRHGVVAAPTQYPSAITQRIDELSRELNEAREEIAMLRQKVREVDSWRDLGRAWHMLHGRRSHNVRSAA